MSKDPAVLFYPADFLTGTMLMDYDAKGRYITLLCLQQQMGPIKEKNFKEICGKKFEEISEKFEQDSKGNYFNRRMKQEIERRKKYSESRRSNGSKGGRPKKAKEKLDESTEKPYAKPYGYAQDNHTETEIYNNNLIDQDHVTDQGDLKKDKVGEVAREVVPYLNDRCGTNYRAGTKKTQELIRARMNEGATLEDFKTVIDKKVADWTGTEYEKFLRPLTLFGTKFESYLNQRITRKGTGNESKRTDSSIEERAAEYDGTSDAYEKFFK